MKKQEYMGQITKYYDVKDVENALNVSERTAYNIIKKYVPEAGYFKEIEHQKNKLKRSKKYILPEYYYDLLINYTRDKGGFKLPPEEETVKADIEYYKYQIKNLLSRCVILYGNKDYPLLDRPLKKETVTGYNNITEEMETREFDEVPFDFHIMNEDLFEEWKKEYFKKHHIKEDDEN